MAIKANEPVKRGPTWKVDRTDCMLRRYGRICLRPRIQPGPKHVDTKEGCACDTAATFGSAKERTQDQSVLIMRTISRQYLQPDIASSHAIDLCLQDPGSGTTAL